MTSTVETGYEKNLANFDVIISSVQGIGPDYKPVKSVLSIDSMLNISTSCKKAMDAVRAAIAHYRAAVDERESAFAKIGRLMTRISNTAKVSEISADNIQTVRSMIRKVLGKRVKPKRTDEQKKADIESGTDYRESSSSQMSYDNQIGNFLQVVEFLSSMPYKPNEKELQIESLRALADEMKKKNAEVISASTALFNARALRNDLMFKEITGLVPVAMDAKAYIKAAFGPSSAHFKKVSGLEFRKN